LAALLLNSIDLNGQPNGWAHLPPIIARQPTLKTTSSANWPPHPRAEGGQVEPVLGGVDFFCTTITHQ